uniref:Cytochrome b5 reductase 4 n=1 Tax=Lutzomyia longipalpis TaxID=7200 RepID=A0A1B0CV03_LUTLO
MVKECIRCVWSVGIFIARPSLSFVSKRDMTLCGWCFVSKHKRHRNNSIVSSQQNQDAVVTTEVTTANNMRKEQAPPSGDGGAASTAVGLKVTPEVTTKVISRDDDVDDDGNPRNKCALKPGHSLMDWIRLGSSGCDLAGTKGVVSPVSHAELAKHCKKGDAWIAIRGKVYNVTRYMDFHPGGSDELMRGVGKDATKLFEEVHAWVNYEQLLGKCYIGPLRNVATLNLDAGTKGVVSPVSHAELAKHCKKGDAWIAIRGKVYNVTRYMDFHPGGSDELMRGVGKDATKLFEEVHAWVNYEQLLGKCYIGPLRNVATLNLDGLDFPSGQSNKTQSPTSANNGGFRLPFSISLTPTPTPTAPPTPEKTPDIQPRFDWIQKTSDLTIIFYTKSLCNPGLTVEQLTDVDTEVRVIVERQTFTYHLKFAHEVQWPCVTRIALESGKVELIFRKAQPALWTTYGTMERKRGGGDVEPKEYDAITCHKFNHDSYAIVLRPKRKLLQVQPIGYHISVTVRVQGTGEATRSYTPVPGLYLPVPCPGSCLALLVKSYTSGIVSKSLTSSTSAGSAFRVSQPRGNFALYRLKNHCRIALLAAGSGITPILGIIDYLLERSNNRIELLKLLYFNRTEEDIWCRGKLEAIANKDTSISLTPTPTPTAPPTPEKTPDIQPRFDWIQKTSDLTIIFYTKSLCNPGLTVEQLTDVDTEVRVIIERQTFTYHLKFAHEVQWPCVTRIALESGKVELIFRKAQPALWTTYGTMERKKGGGDVEPKEYDAITCHKFNHDSYAIVLRPKRKLLQVQPIGYHISVTVRVQGSGEATRSYTPVPGLYLPVPCPGSCLALLVKSYTSGIVSKSLTSSTSAGSALRVSQPRGNFALYRLKNHCRIALLAAGSGITPILGIIDYLLERSNNRIELLKLLYFNRTEEDIWCRGKLEAIANKDTRFSVRHILSEPKGTWGGERGRISDEIATDLASRTSPTSAITFCCVCGPPPFNDAAITHLAGAGFTSDDVHVFQG